MRIIILFLLVLIFNCSAAPYKQSKVNGVSFVAAPKKVDDTHVMPVVNVNANYAAIMPFGFIKSLEHPNIDHNTDKQWFGETRAGAKQYIEVLRKQNIKVMIKPQIWVWRGEFTGKIMMTSEEAWKALEDSYTSFILEYTELAEEVNAELLCIGTELELFVKYRPEYWFKLITKIRSIYKGKLTYAANWDEFRRTPFWDKLDYIGIDAYFPVSNKKTPTYQDCIEGWETHKPRIEKIAKAIDKPILFTEYGYRSVDYSGKEPWVSDHTMIDVNLEAQVNTTKALFETFWKEEWFAGGFIWKWFIMHDEVGGENDPMFTPQNKPVEVVISKQYAAYK
jgi:hypothetical protein